MKRKVTTIIFVLELMVATWDNAKISFIDDLISILWILFEVGFRGFGSDSFVNKLK